jgi:predicted lipoprotein with Yx(FWY)xxD motif
MTGRLTAALLAGLALAACGDGGDATPTDSGSRTTTTAATSAAPSKDATPTTKPGTEIVAADSKFGQMLFDDRKQAIYLFAIETTDEPKCYGDCAEAWPPVLTDGDPVAGRSVKASLLGTTERPDGTTQVTYGGHPLYYYAHEGPGEVECHDVFLNGGKWYVVQPNGDRA